MRQERDQLLNQRARGLRRDATPFERELWFALRAKRFHGTKFSRQVVIGSYIVDFAARSRRLVIEIDGDTHGRQVEYDERRTAWLVEQGYRVIRFTNRDVGENLEGVLSAIELALADTPSPNPLPEGERA